MNVEPANVDQVIRASNGRMITIDHDTGSIVKQLKEIDPNLGVRFAEYGDPPFFAVYYQDQRTTYLVLTQKAYQGVTGGWTGLDQRIVDRVRRISHESYDFAGEVDRQNRQATKDRDRRYREQLQAIGEEAWHALGQDLGRKTRIAI